MTKVQILNPHFRLNTNTDLRDVVFKFALPKEKVAALGDMIAWLPAINWVAKEYNYVRGHLIVPGFFHEIAVNALQKYPHWRIYKNEIPGDLLDGVMLQEQLPNPANATGFHLVDLGFVYFAGVNPPPEGERNYLQLDFSDFSFNKVMPEKYAVLTPVYEANTRRLEVETWNKIIEHLSRLSVTPVLLGKTSLDRRDVKVPEGLDYSRCLNLINQTSLMEAAFIMKNAVATLGVDNGLLHLAGMTDAAIVYGYTIAGPDQRQIPRPHGHTIELYPDREVVPCIFCQERVRFFQGHSFTECVYKLKTPDCVRALNAESFILAIDSVLKEKAHD